MKRVHTNFEAAFTNGYVFETDEGRVPIRVKRIGELVVPSGRIVACDPSDAEFGRPVFSRCIPSGRYAVLLSLACYGKFQRPACAMLQLNSAKPVRWSLATRVGERLSDLKGRSVFGFGVDAGLACFVDAEALELVVARQSWREELFRTLKKNRDVCFQTVLDPQTKANMIAFNIGIGDGFYASYWGFDRRNRLASLVTDFGMFVADIPAEIEIKDFRRLFDRTLEHSKLRRAGIQVRLERAGEKRPSLRIRYSGGHIEVRLITPDGETIADSNASDVTERGGINTMVLKCNLDRAHEAKLVLSFSLGMRGL